jgi:DNA/RNA endonuclease YhcR with UshA esterase domain
LGQISLDQARESSDGAAMRVRGVATVLPGIFGSQYFYITDGAGGIQIYQNKKDFPELAVGDSVEVYGIVGTAYGERRLKVRNRSDIDILSTNNIATSTKTDISEIDEANLGALIKIQGEITEIKSNFMYVDDGAAEAVVYFKKGALIDKKKFVEGENVEVLGVLARASSGLQIWPRAQGDIVSLGPSEDLLKKQTVTPSGANSSKDMAKTYLTTTAGGMTALILAFLARARGMFLMSGVKRLAVLVGKFFRRG